MSDIPAGAAAALQRTVEIGDVVSARPVTAMMATFGRAGPAPRSGDPIPPLWHGLFCVTALPPGRLAEDGLPRDEPLLPDIHDLPRRLFAGARYTFGRPIRIGERIVRTSRITRFQAKEGRSGRLLFACVEHRISGPKGVAVIEENDIVYREAPRSSHKRASPEPDNHQAIRGSWSWRIEPDPVLMFRHSALTFNANRVHYDRDYARAQGLPGCLVQAALIARLILEAINENTIDVEIGSFSFRAMRPVYDTGPIAISGRRNADLIDIRVLDHTGAAAMTAQATIRN